MKAKSAIAGILLFSFLAGAPASAKGPQACQQPKLREVLEKLRINRVGRNGKGGLEGQISSIRKQLKGMGADAQEVDDQSTLLLASLFPSAALVGFASGPIVGGSFLLATTGYAQHEINEAGRRESAALPEVHMHTVNLTGRAYASANQEQAQHEVKRAVNEQMGWFRDAAHKLHQDVEAKRQKLSQGRDFALIQSSSMAKLAVSTEKARLKLLQANLKYDQESEKQILELCRRHDAEDAQRPAGAVYARSGGKRVLEQGIGNQGVGAAGGRTSKGTIGSAR